MKQKSYVVQILKSDPRALTSDRLVAARFPHASTKIAINWPENENGLFPKLGA